MATMSWRDWHESSRERMWEKSKASYGVTGAVFTGGSSSFYHSRNIFGEINCWCYSKRFKHFHLASMLQSRIQFISALASPLLNFAVPILCRVLFAIMSICWLHEAWKFPCEHNLFQKKKKGSIGIMFLSGKWQSSINYNSALCLTFYVDCAKFSLVVLGQAWSDVTIIC